MPGKTVLCALPPAARLPHEGRAKVCRCHDVAGYSTRIGLPHSTSPRRNRSPDARNWLQAVEVLTPVTTGSASTTRRETWGESGQRQPHSACIRGALWEGGGGRDNRARAGRGMDASHAQKDAEYHHASLRDTFAAM
nr:hypothetical protein CFP56_07484 [Quercus suber]